MSHTLEEVVHLDEMRARLPHRFSGAANLDALLSISAASFQQLETALLDLQMLRTIDTATGVQLDGIGELLNVPRTPGQDDTSYRFTLKTATIILTKSGEPEAVIEAYLNVMGAITATFVEIYPATFQIGAIPTVDTTDPDVAAFITNTMQSVKPAGVRMLLLVLIGFELSQANEALANGNGPASETEGFGDANALTADRFIRTATGDHKISQVYTTTAHANTLFQLSVWMRIGTLTGNVRLRLRDGSETELIAQEFTPTSTFQKFTISGTFGATPAANIKVYVDPVNDTGAAGDSLYLWNAHLQQGAGENPNLLTGGSEFANAAWVTTNGSVVSNDVADPYNGAGGGLARAI